MFPNLKKGEYGVINGEPICFKWEIGKCLECGATTAFNDEMTGHNGVLTPLCSEECKYAFWDKINNTCNTKESPELMFNENDASDCVYGPCDKCRFNRGEFLCEQDHYTPIPPNGWMYNDIAPTRVGDVGEFYVHPREWLNMENDILFVPGDKVSGTLVDKGDGRFICEGDEEDVEVLNPNGFYYRWFYSGDIVKNYGKLKEQFGKIGETNLNPGDFLAEECAELIEALIHFKRGRENSIEEVINEIADVRSLIDCTMKWLHITEADVAFFQQRLVDLYVDTPNDGHHAPTRVG